MREVGYVHFADLATMIVKTDGKIIIGEFPGKSNRIEFETPEQVYDAALGFAVEHLEIDPDSLVWENA